MTAPKPTAPNAAGASWNNLVWASGEAMSAGSSSFICGGPEMAPALPQSADARSGADIPSGAVVPSAPVPSVFSPLCGCTTWYWRRASWTARYSISWIWRGAEDGAPVVGDAKVPLEMGERGGLEQAQGGGHLGGRALEELEPGRRVEEEVLRLHRGARRRRDQQLLAHRAPFPAHERAGLRAPRTREHREAGDRADGGEGLAAEAQGGDRVEVRVGGELGGGVPQEGQVHLVGRHADAVVGDPDQRAAGVPQVDGHLGAERVERVLHQLLDHRGRPLHHLAGRDLVDEVIGQPADARGGHRRALSRCCHSARRLSACSGVIAPVSSAASSRSSGSWVGGKRPSWAGSPAGGSGATAAPRPLRPPSSSPRIALARPITAGGSPASRATSIPSQPSVPPRRTS